MFTKSAPVGGGAEQFEVNATGQRPFIRAADTFVKIVPHDDRPVLRAEDEVAGRRHGFVAPAGWTPAGERRQVGVGERVLRLLRIGLHGVAGTVRANQQKDRLPRLEQKARIALDRPFARAWCAGR